MRAARTLLMLMAALLSLTLHARAAGIIRDSEIEYALRELARPLASAAGVSMGTLRIYLIDDRSLNAFVADQQTMFLHTGLLLRLTTAEQVQAVLAHEIAHIANGHISRRGIASDNARTAAGIGLLLAAAAGAASGNSEAAFGLAIGSQAVAQRAFFAHTRAEEASADQAGLRYMARSGVNPQSAAEVLSLFRGQEALSSDRQDPYVRSHPLTRDRLRAVEAFVAALDYQGTPDPGAERWFARAQAKLDGYSRNPSDVLRRAPARDTSEAAMLRRALAWHRQAKTDKALDEIDRLIARQPGDPYPVETKAQILLESRRFAEAARVYARASGLAPGDALILAGQGRALLAAGDHRAALPVLEKAAARDAANPRLLRDLATAYSKSGNDGMAALSVAEARAIVGQLADARTLAVRASELLPQGSPGWRRAQDVIRVADRALKRKRN